MFVEISYIFNNLGLTLPCYCDIVGTQTAPISSSKNTGVMGWIWANVPKDKEIEFRQWASQYEGGTVNQEITIIRFRME